jgi:hypothetical protein
MKLRNALVSITAIVLFASAASAQQSVPSAPPLVGSPGVEPVSIGGENQYQVSFHRPVVKDSSLVKIPDTDMIEVSDALSNDEVNKGFSAGEMIVVRVKAPADSYVYVVNNSTWDGVKLVTDGEKLLGRRSRDFVYKLTNKDDNVLAGTEQLMFIFSKSEMNKKAMDKFKSALTDSKSPAGDVSGKSGGFSLPASLGSVAKLACAIGSIPVPFLKEGCELFGFGELKLTQLIGNVIGLKPEAEDKNVAVQLSFPIRPKTPETAK